MHMDDPKQPSKGKTEDMPEVESDWHRDRLNQLGIDPDAGPIDILVQLAEHFQRKAESS
jgi:hypothetical protein